MENLKNFRSNLGFWIFATVVLFMSCSEEKQDMIPMKEAKSISGMLTFKNVGARAFIFTAISGTGINAELNIENATLDLKIGNRYQFVNAAGPNHPFQIQGIGDQILLSQNDLVGTMEDDMAVDYQVRADTITFTLTQNLANQIAPYVCGNHSSMSGSINAIN